MVSAALGTQPDVQVRANEALLLRLAGHTHEAIAGRLRWSDESDAGHGVTRLLARTEAEPPGLLAGDDSTWPLRRMLRGLGYRVHGWRLGRNLGPTTAAADGMQDRLHGLHIGRPGSSRARLQIVTTFATSAVLVVAACAAPLPTGAERTAFATPVPAAETVTIDGVDYPNPLRRDNGDAVTSSADWEGARRAELLADFRQDVYGQPFPETPAPTFAVSRTDFPGVTRKTVQVTVACPRGAGSFAVTLFVPKTGGKPRGTFLLIDYRGAVSGEPSQSSGYAPVAAILKAGYAFASFAVADVAPDNNSTYRSKMINLFHPSDQDLPDDAGRAISAWAWGASRAMDYLQTDPDIDPAKIAVVGHSRGGKAALWAGAQDTRFAAVVANDSGSTGAKLARRGDGGIGGETVAAITNAFPYWFPPTYNSYSNRVSALPVDQHELLALIAPRRVVLGSATDDANADPEGEFLAYVAAAPVYALYGLGDTGLPSTTWPPTAGQGFRGPAMSYHLRPGGHGLTAADWDFYLNGDLFSR